MKLPSLIFALAATAQADFKATPACMAGGTCAGFGVAFFGVWGGEEAFHKNHQNDAPKLGSPPALGSAAPDPDTDSIHKDTAIHEEGTKRKPPTALDDIRKDKTQFILTTYHLCQGDKIWCESNGAAPHPIYDTYVGNKLYFHSNISITTDGDHVRSTSTHSWDEHNRKVESLQVGKTIYHWERKLDGKMYNCHTNNWQFTPADRPPFKLHKHSGEEMMKGVLANKWNYTASITLPQHIHNPIGNHEFDLDVYYWEDAATNKPLRIVKVPKRATSQYQSQRQMQLTPSFDDIIDIKPGIVDANAETWITARQATCINRHPSRTNAANEIVPIAPYDPPTQGTAKNGPGIHAGKVIKQFKQTQRRALIEAGSDAGKQKNKMSRRLSFLNSFVYTEVLSELSYSQKFQIPSDGIACFMKKKDECVENYQYKNCVYDSDEATYAADCKSKAGLFVLTPKWNLDPSIIEAEVHGLVGLTVGSFPTPKIPLGDTDLFATISGSAKFGVQWGTCESECENGKCPAPGGTCPGMDFEGCVTFGLYVRLEDYHHVVSVSICAELGDGGGSCSGGYVAVIGTITLGDWWLHGAASVTVSVFFKKNCPKTYMFKVGGGICGASYTWKKGPYDL